MPADEAQEASSGYEGAKPNGWFSRVGHWVAGKRKRHSDWRAEVRRPSRNVATPADETTAPPPRRSLVRRAGHAWERARRVVSDWRPDRSRMQRNQEEDKASNPAQDRGCGVSVADAIRAIINEAAERTPEQVVPIVNTANVARKTVARVTARAVQDVATRWPGVHELIAATSRDVGSERLPGKRRKRDRPLARLRGRQPEGRAGPELEI